MNANGAGCPFEASSGTASPTSAQGGAGGRSHPPDDRRAIHPRDTDGPRVDHLNGLWRVRSLDAARQLLRTRKGSTQAGFTAERIPDWLFAHRPILISDGPEHDDRRRAVARFFAPAVVADRYTGLMQECADRLIVAAGPRVRLDDLALVYVVDVTSEVVGLTTERPRDTADARARRVRRTARRLEAFFRQPPFDLTRPGLGRTGREWASAAVRGLDPLVRFWWADVRPAIRQRRRRPGRDVVSHLIAEGASDASILVEAVTYGTAGMVTTREFVCMAAWHLLTDDVLRDRFLTSDAAGRRAVLAEVMRVEPPVGHLYRRAATDLTLTDRGREYVVRAGDLVDIAVRDTNVDPDAVHPDSRALRPGRPRPPGCPDTLLSFGDGEHRCPGEPLALLETQVLLTRLLERGARLVGDPVLGWNDLIAGYTVRGLVLDLGGGQPGP